MGLSDSDASSRRFRQTEENACKALMVLWLSPITPSVRLAQTSGRHAST